MAKYFICFALYTFYWIGTSTLGNALREYGMNTFKLFPYTVCFVTVQFLVGGMLLVVPSFMELNTQPGKWKFDYKKFAGAGIPAWYLGFHSLFYFIAPSITIPSFFHISISLQEPMLLFLGFIFLSSFYKESE
ncbi:hypothetical protein D3H55_02730 [Bacillus salacetis]|uniref:Uncharacterized protein n=1 Tax=Bacillus salacetis TaxID=2315464 RepID=A0A3A1R6L0_9BACI|nr:hypothetical protein [Bacillus salacetis]RIW38468.1 hypothetical protein D3H55_02730 [Bacillus salacetis]